MWRGARQLAAFEGIHVAVRIDRAVSARCGQELDPKPTWHQRVLLPLAALRTTVGEIARILLRELQGLEPLAFVRGTHALDDVRAGGWRRRRFRTAKFHRDTAGQRQHRDQHDRSQHTK